MLFRSEDHEVSVLRSIDTEAELFELETSMRPEAHEIAVSILLYGLDGEPAPERGGGPVDVGEANVEERELGDAISRPEARGEFIPIEPEFMQQILAEPIEDWMIFLHPDQIALVERTFDGPARIRGASGTGKTVVALHRAAREARAGRKVLFTSFITSLPPVLEQLLARLDPDAVDSVEFTHLHGWARSRLDINGGGPSLNQKLVDNAWSNAWKRMEDRSVRKLGSAYVREEVTSVIRARYVESVEDYLALNRVGRRVPLGERQRRGVWEASEAYTTALRRLGTVDHTDVLQLALDDVEGEEALFDVVIVDEAQDLDAVGVRLAAALCGGAEGRLLLVGDGQQSVYPGAWTMADVGLDVRGRSAVLRTNYRNTAEIIDTAMRLVAGREYADGDANPADGLRDFSTLRTGEEPTMAVFRDKAAHDAAMVDRINELIARQHVAAGDILIACPDNRAADQTRAILGEAGFQTMDLRSYRGQIDKRIKVGTCLRAKGLEFKHVLVPRFDLAAARMKTAEADSADALARQLFVAMGRARDGLWLGSVDPDGKELFGEFVGP